MIRTIIESPLGSPDPAQIARNIRYARLCMLHCLRRGWTPYASHLLITQVWDDMDDDLRARGIAAGHAWYTGAEQAVVFTDLGRSAGMNAGINAAINQNVPVRYEKLDGDLMAMLEGGKEPAATVGAT